MSEDLIKRSDAIKALKWREGILHDTYTAVAIIRSVPSADRPSEVIYGNEHNCIMTIFGECSYSETGCGDCAVVEKVRKALSADRPQGEWIEMGQNEDGTHNVKCNQCGNTYKLLGHAESIYTKYNYRFCPHCGARMKGADDETTTV